MKLRPPQIKTLSALAASLRQGHRKIVVQAPTGMGKCLGYGTLILMFDGRAGPVQDVRPGDRLMGPDSLPRTVLSTHRGRGPRYRVVPTKGDPYIVNESHILSLQITGNQRVCGHEPGSVVNISVRDYLDAPPYFTSSARAGVLVWTFPPPSCTQTCRPMSWGSGWVTGIAALRGS